MCESHSESGQPCGFTPCEAYIKLLSERSRLEGHCKGFEEGTDLLKSSLAKETALLQNSLAREEKAEAENAALRQENLRLEFDNAALRQERDALRSVVEKADALAEKVQNLKWKMRENMLGDVLIRPGLFDATVGAMVAYQEARHAKS